MFILRRNKDNQIVAEQAICPEPEQIVTATQNDMTWRCNTYGETVNFMEASNAALTLLNKAKPTRAICLEDDERNEIVTINSEISMEHVVIKHLGHYFQLVRNRQFNGYPVFRQVELYEINLY